MFNRTLPRLLEQTHGLIRKVNLVLTRDEEPRILQVPILLEELSKSYGRVRFHDIVRPVVSELHSRLTKPMANLPEDVREDRREGAKRLRLMARHKDDPAKFLEAFAKNFMMQLPIQLEMMAMDDCVFDGPPNLEQLLHGSLVANVQHLMDPQYRLSFRQPIEAASVETWLAWERLVLGPAQRAAINFYRKDFASRPRHDPVEHAETLYGKLDAELADREYLVGDGAGKYSVADIANFCWVNIARYSGIKFERFQNLQRWWARIEERPAVQQAMKRHKQRQLHMKFNNRLLDYEKRNHLQLKEETELEAIHQMKRMIAMLSALHQSRLR